MTMSAVGGGTARIIWPSGQPTFAEQAQAAFASLCASLGLRCATAYGRDEPIELLEQWNVVRPQRYPERPNNRLELDWP